MSNSAQSGASAMDRLIEARTRLKGSFMCAGQNHAATKSYSLSSNFRNEHIQGSPDDLIVETTCLNCDEMFISDLRTETLGSRQQAHLRTCRHGITAVPNRRS